MNVETVRYDAPDREEKFCRSLRETGFAVLRAHPIPQGLPARVYQEWTGFFASPDKEKHRFDPATQAGYFPFRLEKAKGYDQEDLKEFYHYYPRYPLPVAFSPATEELRAALDRLAQQLLGWVERSLPEDLRRNLSEPLGAMVDGSEMTLLRVLHYPPLRGVEPAGAVRAAAHEDINLITLLVAATTPGLEVKDRAGNWRAVDCDPGSIVVNAGDMLQECTGGHFPSTTHRVTNPAGAPNVSRMSIPLFLHPRPDVRLSERYTAKEYLRERLTELGLV